MAEERKQKVPRQIKTVFVGDETLPTHYVNSVNIRSMAIEKSWNEASNGPVILSAAKNPSSHPAQILRFTQNDRARLTTFQSPCIRSGMEEFF